MPIKSFRGSMAPGEQQKISLSTNNGVIGYKITKISTISTAPGTTSHENVLKIFSIDQLISATNPTTATIDFSDQTLLGVSYFKETATTTTPYDMVVIFDNVVFNQDIYLTMQDARGETATVNYYIELEQIKLDLNENTVATLKDIRNIEASKL